MDQNTVTQGEYLRVTLRGEQPFRGFLVKALDYSDFRNKSEYDFLAYKYKSENGIWTICKSEVLISSVWVQELMV